MLKRFARLWDFILRKFGFRKESSAPIQAPQDQLSPTPRPPDFPHFVPSTPQQPAPLAAPELVIPSYEPAVYKAKDSLFTFREKVFFSALLDAVKWDYWTFAKVRMGDIISLANEPENRKFYNNQDLCKHLDFVLCEKQSFKPILVIELDDSSHHHIDKQMRDEFKDKTFADVGLPLMRVPIQKSYAPNTLREEILSKIKGNKQTKGV